MKRKYTFLFLLISAWPLYYLYQHQLGAISFLVLSIFFFVQAMKELKMLKNEKKSDIPSKTREKNKQNSR
ncbi:hypothetical protein [Neobacillus vireti]|uniref:hypothetical protein n=1 Tax=Neobacillus vireti TaxID=220686 RepID=UPI002FFF1CD8